MAVPAERRSGAWLHDRPPSRLPHAVRPSREDQLREDRKGSPADLSGELGSGQRRDATERPDVTQRLTEALTPKPHRTHREVPLAEHGMRSEMIPPLGTHRQ